MLASSIIACNSMHGVMAGCFKLQNVLCLSANAACLQVLTLIVCR